MSDVYEKLIEENVAKGFRIYLTVSEFRGETYLHFRKYFLSYEEDWLPSQEGVSMTLSIENTCAIIDGVLDILSQSEGEQVITKYYELIKANNDIQLSTTSK